MQSDITSWSLLGNFFRLLLKNSREEEVEKNKLHKRSNGSHANYPQ